MAEVYDVIDSNMGPSNIGGRKGRNARDHILVVNSVLNEAAQNKSKKIDINVYDVAKCFDKMAYKPTSNDVFDAGVTDENFVVLALANETSKVAVKTP